MRPLHWNIAGTVIVGVGFALLAGAADSPKPTEPIKLNVKLGLWEIATQANISGMPPLSDDILSKMTPDQRARMQAAMQASMADAAKPKLAKHCVTAEKVARGLDMERHDSSDCQKKIATNTASELELNETCAGADGTMVLNEHIQLSGSLLGGSEQMTGSVHFVKTTAGKTMTVDSTIKGKWLDASCGDIKDFQLEK